MQLVRHMVCAASSVWGQRGTHKRYLHCFVRKL